MKLDLTVEEAAQIHYAMYIAYGNDPPSVKFWQKFRKAAGDDWREILKLSGKIHEGADWNQENWAL